MVNDYINWTSKGARRLIVAVNKTSDSPVIIGTQDVVKCNNSCYLSASALFVKTIVNRNFSLMLRGHYLDGWPIALITLEKNFRPKINF